MFEGIKLRPKQQQILTYQGGRMGISAVPGSGKTFTLSLLAAKIIGSSVLSDDQEVLVVTLVNSAVDNFYQRVSNFITQANLVPNLGYRVRTLHGLAHDIVRERPELAGLDINFQITDQGDSENILKDVLQSWLHDQTKADRLVNDFFLESITDEQLFRVKERNLLPLLSNLASNFIRTAKDRQLDPEWLKSRLEELPVPMDLVDICTEWYVDYQRALSYRGSVDFDDLIRLALSVLQQDPLLLERLQYRWPFILEDEAQDSSNLQQEILSMLAGDRGNWVRVGDPNQAIYETFTTANPKYLRQFIQDGYTQARDLPNSGRSTLSIIKLANYFVQWTMQDHPISEVQDALIAPPYIEPTPPNDPQPNLLDIPGGIKLVDRAYDPQEEVEAISKSLKQWLTDNPGKTVAVLSSTNHHLERLRLKLDREEIAYNDSLLKVSQATRKSATVITTILRYLSNPSSTNLLANVLLQWKRDEYTDEKLAPNIKRASEIVRRIHRLEDFLWPSTSESLLESTTLAEDSPLVYDLLLDFRLLIRRWQGAVILPIDQLILTIAQDLFSHPVELAIAHKMAVAMRRVSQDHPSWKLPQLTEEVSLIAQNERRFIGFSADDIGFNPDDYRGIVVIATIHKAKGLEWDRVYIMSANNYDFPSGQSYDSYIAEKWFLKDGLNLPAEGLMQLDFLTNRSEYSWYQPGQATQQARLDYIRERLRLFYVGITRARSELTITWNNGSYGEARPCLPFIALKAYLDKANLLEEENHESA
jgi:DNA helicase-2/ATP-dependent DNA helicase PcrA